MHIEATDDEGWTAYSRTMVGRVPFPSGSDRLYLAVMSEPWQILLDFGCGTGLWAGCLRREGARYMGLDRNPAAVDLARARWSDDPYLQFVLCDVLSGQPIPIPDGGVDVVVTAGVLQHNSGPHKALVLPEIRRVLMRGGRYCGYERTYGQPIEGRVEWQDCHGLTADGWRRLFESNGFATVLQDRDLHIFRAV